MKEVPPGIEYVGSKGRVTLNSKLNNKANPVTGIGYNSNGWFTVNNINIQILHCFFVFQRINLKFQIDNIYKHPN